MKFSPGSLATRLLILFLLLALVPLTLVAALSFDWGQRRIRTRVENHLEGVAILKEQEIGEWVEHLEHTLAWLVDDPHTREWVPTLITSSPGESDYARAYDALAEELRRMATLEHVTPILLLDARDGRILVASDPSWEGEYRNLERWFSEGQTETWVSSFYYSQRLERATMVIATPVATEEGEVVAVLAGHANLDDLQAVMLERSGLGETGETYLVNAGNLLVTESRFEPEATFHKWIFTEGVDRALAGECGVGIYDDYRETPVIGAYRWLEGLNAALLVEVDRAEAFAPIATLRQSVIAVGIAVALAVAVLGVVISRGLTTPLDVMVEGAETIGAGNLDHRIAVSVGGEIGQLAEAFNRMTEQLQDSRRRTAETLAFNQRIISATTLGITVYKASGECVLANEASARIVGTTRDQVLKQNFHRIHSWQTSGLLDAAREALRSGEMERREVFVTSSFGRHIWLDCRFAPFTVEQKPHLLVLTDDVTDRKRMKEQLVRQERLATLGQLSGSIAHELRNPMGAIKNAAFFLDLAVDDPDPEVQEALEITEREIDRSEGIIRALLDFVHQSPPARQELCVHEVLRETLARVEISSEIEVEARLNPGLPLIQADRHQLDQVFENLIQNAIQAMPEGGRLVLETSGVSQDRGDSEREDWVTISISDTGQGIAEEDLERVFVPLFSTKVKGIGLGLSIVETLVKGHGGSVEVESELGAGSTFTVRLPVEGDVG